MRKSDRDLSGLKFGRWTVIRPDGYLYNCTPAWLCRCECGNEKTVSMYSLLNGSSTSCGCYAKELTHDRIKHGGSRNSGYERLYLVWLDMKDRCYNPNCKSYKDYGGKGIHICNEWLHDYGSFRSWAYLNGYNDSARRYECTIDRIDFTKDYSPENCRWANAQTQANNRKSNVKYEYMGEEHTLYEWSKLLNFNIKLVRGRINAGWSFERAITTKFNPAKEYMVNGEFYTVAQLSKLYNIPVSTLRGRIYRGLSVEDAIKQFAKADNNEGGD